MDASGIAVGSSSVVAASSPAPIQQGIHVCVRVRPMSTKERADPTVKSAVDCLSSHVILDLSVGKSATRYLGSRNAQPKPLQFPFHSVFHPQTSQSEVYSESCASIVQGAFIGINGAIMAYGATGSGKTHSMFGAGMSAPGVIFQAAQELFCEKQRLQELNPEMYVKFSCSFVEVYNEEVYDLLNQENRSKPLQVQDVGAEELHRAAQGRNGESFALRGLVTMIPRDVDDFVSLVERGLHNRATAATNANAQSSRSHAIVTVEVEVKEREDSARGTLARLRFCDLAGCERAAQLVSSNERLREGAKINHSLLELGRVMQALAAAALKQQQQGCAPPKQPFISWRGSKLTRLMKDCLSGNCRTTLLVCISPSSDSIDDSRNAMLFAMKAKEVQLTAKANEYTACTPEVAREQAKVIEKLREVILVLKESLRQKTGSCVVEGLEADIAAEFGLGEGGTRARSHPQPAADEELSTAMSSSRALATTRHTPQVEKLAASPLPPATALGEAVPWHTDAGGSPPCTSTPALQNTLTELQESMKSLSDKKAALHLQIKDSNQACSDINWSIRAEQTLLASFMARNGTLLLQEDASNPPPLSIVNAQIRIRNLAIRHKACRQLSADLEHQLLALDEEVASIRKRLCKERSGIVMDLVLERANLVDCTAAAEALATQYHQEKWSQERQIDELMVTQERLQSSLHRLMKYAPADCDERKDAAVALAFAEMARLDTSEMLDGFKRKMQALFPSFAASSAGAAPLSSSACQQQQAAVASTPSAGGSLKPRTGARGGGSLAFTIAANENGVRSGRSAAATSSPADGSWEGMQNCSFTALATSVPASKAKLRHSLSGSIQSPAFVLSPASAGAFYPSSATSSAAPIHSGPVAFARTMSTLSSMTSSWLKKVPASSTPTVMARELTKKPPVPFTSGAEAGARAAQGISAKTSSSSNALGGGSSTAAASTRK